MPQSDGRPEGGAANLNIAATKFGNGGRRIEHLKQLAYDCNLTAEQARAYGKLSATATWEKLLTAHGLEFEPKIEPASSTTGVSSSQISPINFLEWVNLSQLIAVTLASAGVILLLMNLWPRALNVIPRPVHFKIEFSISGDK
jgi:hypothetical protein